MWVTPSAPASGTASRGSPFIDRVDKGIASLWKEEKAKYHMDEDRVNEIIPCFISKTSRLALAEHSYCYPMVFFPSIVLLSSIENPDSRAGLYQVSDGKRNPQKQKQKLEKVAVARSERLRRVGPKLYQLFWTWVTPWARRLRRLNWGFPLRLSKRPTYLTLDGDESPHSIAFPVSYDSSRDSAEEGSSQPTFYPIGPYTFLVNLASSRLRPSVPIPRPYYLGGPCFLLLMELLL
ncbi:hypothetical protein V6N12_075954 [Hibiscus sabdariffa]|uniref:Uncharacterized protein n=1 Tax=Hibiscus sabdariffa TaxID=183260 RepID=A0ABR2AXV8_9ROSI